MDKPTKIFIGGVALAAFVLVLGKGSSYRIARGLRDLHAACVEEVKRDFNPFKAELICEPGELGSLPITSEPLRGIQAQIAAKHARAFGFRKLAGSCGYCDSHCLLRALGMVFLPPQNT